MSDIDLSQLPPPSDDDPPAIKQLRAALEAKDAKLADATADLQKNAAVHKENAFLRAGIDTASPLGQFMYENYDGELTPDAVKLKAEALGIPTGKQEPHVPPATPDEADRQRLQTQLNGDGNVPPPAPDDENPDPWDEGYSAFDARMARGATRERAAAEVLDRVVDAAVKGDQRVIFNQQEWQEQISNA